MKLIDAHAHLLWPNLLSKIDDIMEHAKKGNIINIINSAVGIDEFELCFNLKKKYPEIENTIGIHPEFALEKKNDAAKFKDIFFQHLENFVAIGEIGLDFLVFKDSAERVKITEIFKVMLEIANEAQKPIVIHCRNSEKQAIKILETGSYSDIPGVLMHCFGGDQKWIDACIDHNWCFSIPTSIVYKKLHQNLARTVPLELIMLETDSPFLPPSSDYPYNEPVNVKFVAEEIAKIKEIPIQEVAQTTTTNCRKFFDL
jgi:TatD DNase family protein